MCSTIYVIISQKIGLLIGLSAEQNRYSSIYLMIVESSLILLCLRYALASRLYIVKSTFSNMKVTLFMLIINIIINTLSLIFGVYKYSSLCCV